MKKPLPFASAMPQFIDTLVALLTAGHSPPHALQASTTWATPPLKAVLHCAHQQLARGVRYANVLEQLRSTIGAPSYAMIDALLASDRDGLPLAPVLHRLAAEAHTQRRRQSEQALRQLPIKMLFPLVCCTLPSFILLGVVPMLAASLAALAQLSK
jgi:tight adherence protein C